MTSDALVISQIGETMDLEILYGGVRRFLIRRNDVRNCWHLYTAHKHGVGELLEVDFDIAPLVKYAACLLGLPSVEAENQLATVFAMLPKYDGDQVEIFIDLLEAEGRYRCAARLPGGVETAYKEGFGSITSAKEAMKKWCNLHGYEVGILRVRRDIHRARLVREDMLPIEPW
jgi:hypothetical protein